MLAVHLTFIFYICVIEFL